MTPLGIEILLHYHYSGRDFRDGDFSAPAVREAIDSFFKVENLIALCDRPTSVTYKLTERGQFFVDALLNMPLPVCRWEIPCAQRPQHLG